MNQELTDIIEAMARVEEYNDRFRQPNTNGLYPLCKPVVGSIAYCERCGALRAINQPCPSVPPEQRWGRDYQPK